MSAKIELTASSLAQTSAISPARSSAADSGRSAGAMPTPDKLTLTRDALQMEALDRSMSRGASFDVKRVEALRTQIAQGSYQVDAERVASKLLAAHTDFK